MKTITQRVSRISNFELLPCRVLFVEYLLLCLFWIFSCGLIPLLVYNTDFQFSINRHQHSPSAKAVKGIKSWRINKNQYMHIIYVQVKLQQQWKILYNVHWGNKRRVCCCTHHKHKCILSTSDSAKTLMPWCQWWMLW